MIVRTSEWEPPEWWPVGVGLPACAGAEAEVLYCGCETPAEARREHPVRRGCAWDPAAARILCGECPGRVECAAAGAGEAFGVWGGQTPAERRRKRT